MLSPKIYQGSSIFSSRFWVGQWSAQGRQPRDFLGVLGFRFVAQHKKSRNTELMPTQVWVEIGKKNCGSVDVEAGSY